MDQHLERQGDEGEIDLLQPHADRADRGCDDGRQDQRRDKGDRDRHAGTLHDQAEPIGAEAEKHAMAERDHAGIADQKVERGREQPERRAADHEIEQRLAAEEQRQAGEHSKGDQRDQDVAVARALRRGLDPGDGRGLFGLQFGHATSLPNRPVGRETSTASRRG